MKYLLLITTTLLMFFEPLIVKGQSDLMYKNTSNKASVNQTTKEQQKQLSQNHIAHGKSIDSFYNVLLSNPKRVKIQAVYGIGFTLNGKYNYETFDANIKYEAKNVTLGTSPVYNIAVNAYLPIVDQLHLLTGVNFGFDGLSVNKVSKSNETMWTFNLAANLGLSYNPKGLILQNYFQLGQVFGPMSGFFGNVTGIGFRMGTRTYTLNYRYSGGTSVNVTQSTPTSDKERTYSADAIYLTIGDIAVKMNKEEEAKLKAINNKYENYNKAIINGTNYSSTANPNLANNILKPEPEESLYKDFTDSTLNDLLQIALKNEEFEKADAIQTEINKRIKQNKYAKNNDAELKILLENALKIEDYKTADDIQKEIDKRKSLNKENKTKANNQKQAAKKSLKELEDELKKAMDAEDYKKADEIQKEINKLK